MISRYLTHLKLDDKVELLHTIYDVHRKITPKKEQLEKYSRRYLDIFVELFYNAGDLLIDLEEFDKATILLKFTYEKLLNPYDFYFAIYIQYAIEKITILTCKPETKKYKQSMKKIRELIQSIRKGYNQEQLAIAFERDIATIIKTNSTPFIPHYNRHEK